jgi:cytochrome P450
LSNIGSLRFIRSFNDLQFTGLGIDDIAAQALTFFSAGFEVVATLLSFSTLLLAVHQEIQEQAREEVDKVLAEHGGRVTYEAVQSIKHLDNILSGIGN